MNPSPAHTIVFGFLLLAAAEAAQPAEITYNEQMRPTRFTNLEVNGETYHVTVEWNTSFSAVYGDPASGQTPAFWGSADAWTAAAALQQALLDDGFTPLGLTSYLWVPSSQSSTIINGPGVFLHSTDLPLGNVAAYFNSVSQTAGITRFNLFSDGFEE